MSIQVSIFHYSPDPNLKNPYVTWKGEVANNFIFNDILVMQVKSIRALTDIPYRLSIIDNEMHPAARADLEKRLPDVEIISVPKHERLNGPAGINGCILNNKCDYLVILSTDVLVTWNWLSTWLAHVKNAEALYGVPCAVSPDRLLLYPKNEASIVGYTLEELLKGDLNVPWKYWNGIPVAVSTVGTLYDRGNELGFYMAHRKFWEEVGLHDEEMISTMDGIDMGLRALKTHCRHLLGGGLFLHHVSGLHGNVGCRLYRSADGNWDGCAEFIKKWGIDMRWKVIYGTAWIELHQEQQARTGK